MLLTIDNLDGSGPRDYTNALEVRATSNGNTKTVAGGAQAVRIHRRLNQPTELRLSLLADGNGFVVPSAASRIVLQLDNGTKLFTGYVSQAPAAEYAGWKSEGPVYRYRLHAFSDEFVLDLKMVPARAPFVACTAGQIVRELAAELLPQVFDTSAVSDGVVVPSLAWDGTKCWSEQVSALATRSRAAYRVHDECIHFQAVGTNEYLLDESADTFSFDGLQLGGPVQTGMLSGLPLTANDITVIGASEPLCYVKDYFIGDGYQLSFALSNTPFIRYSHSFIEEEFTGTALDPLRWGVVNPAAVNVSGGKLRVSGGPATITFTELIELGGVMVLQHGDFGFNAASNGMIGGLCSGGSDPTHSLAAFIVQPAGGQTQISAVVNGAAAGSSILAAAGVRYVMTTRVYASEIYRRQQTFHSSLHPAGSGRGGMELPANAHIVMEVHAIDPANPGSPVAPATVLYDGVVGNVPSVCNYVLIDAADLHGDVSFTRLISAVDVEVQSAVPGQSGRTRLVGALSEGADCNVSTTPNLYFYSSRVPAANETIRVSYRSSGPAGARLTDPASMATLAREADDGSRCRVVRIAEPLPRTSADCENAALALLDDSTQRAWAGTYLTWSRFLPDGASDVWPGDGLHLKAPSRGADFPAIVREVAIELVSVADDLCRYELKFANDAAHPLAFTFGAAKQAPLPQVTATTATAGTTFVADLSGAEMTGITSTTVTLDAGCDPLPGGGFEVRRSDTGWGAEYDRNLIGRYAARSFTVTRLSRVQTHYLRQYDSAGRYSRYSTVLHVDYPL